MEFIYEENIQNLIDWWKKIANELPSSKDFANNQILRIMQIAIPLILIKIER